MKLKRLFVLLLSATLLVMCAGCANTQNQGVSPDELDEPDIIIDMTEDEADVPENTTEATTAEVTPTEETTSEVTTTSEETTTESTTAEEVTTTEETAMTTTESTALQATYRKYSATSEYVKLIGRTYLDENKVLWIPQSAGGIEFITTGTDLRITLLGDNTATENSESPVRYAIYVNGERVADKLMRSSDLTLGIKLPEGENTVKLLKLSESANGIIGIKQISILDTRDIKPTPDSTLKIEFIGDSITCGYGVDDENRDHHFSTTTEDATKAYAYKTAQLLNADYSLVCYSGHGIISAYTGDGTINESGLVPKIYTLVGKTWDKSFTPNVNELEWDFSKFEADIVVVNLGTNDNSYVKGNADKASVYTKTYTEFIKQIRKNNPDAHIVCALGIMGADLYPSVEAAAEAYTAETGDENISCVKLGQIRSEEGHAADWHPTEATHTRCAEEMVKHLITVSEEAKSLYEANN